MAGFGTAGSVLACVAALFFIAGAVVAFHGWPQIAGQAGPATVSIGAGAGGAGLHGRRLAGVTVSTVSSRPASSRGARHTGASGGTPRTVGAGRPGGAVGATGNGGGGKGSGEGSGSGGGGGGGGGSGGGPGQPTGGGGGPPTGGGGPPTGGGGPPTGGGPPPGGSGPGVTVTVRTPLTPPITVTVPTGGAGTIVTKVTGKIGGPVGKVGQGLGTVLGG